MVWSAWFVLRFHPTPLPLDKKKEEISCTTLQAETEISSSFAGIHRRRFKLYFQFSRSTSSANVT